MKRLWVPAAAALLLASCMTTYNLSPVRSDAVEIFYYQDHEVALATRDDLAVGLYAYSDGQNLILNVGYINDGGERIDVIPEALTVTAIDEYGVRTALKVYPGEEYLRKVKNAQAWALALQAVAGAMEASSAAYSTTTTYGTFNGSGTYGSWSGTSRTYDPARQRAVQRANDEQLQQQAGAYRQRNMSLEQRLLRKTTVFPGASIQGDVMVERRKAARYEIGVPFGGRVFRFEFTIDEP